MRKLITLLLLAATTIINAREIDYFADNPQWRMHVTFGGALPCLEFWNYVYWVNGYDTIDDKVYARLQETGTRQYNWQGPPPNQGCSGTDNYSNLRGLYRQEDQKIYERDGNTDIMLYDFDLEAGDTLPDSPILFENNIYVTSIDSILMGEHYRKVFSLSSNVWGTADQLIEGIGFVYGFLSGFPDWFYPEQLVCFYLNGEILYENPEAWAPCDVFVGLEESTISDSKFMIYPNPTSGNITVKTESQSSSHAQIAVSDLTGRTLYSEAWQLNTGKNTKSLDLSGFTSGMYFITLTGENGENLAKEKILVE